MSRKYENLYEPKNKTPKLISESDVSGGRSTKTVENKLGILNKNRVLFAGLYPPKNAHEDFQHDNRTSRMIANRFGHFDFDWIDIYTESPYEKSSNIKLPKLKKYLQQNPNRRSEWYRKISDQIKEIKQKKFKPVVYICGQDCRDEWKKIEEVVKTEKLIHPIVKLYDLDNSFVLYGEHPSAHLMKHGEEKSVLEFYTNMRILDFLLHNHSMLQSIIWKG